MNLIYIVFFPLRNPKMTLLLPPVSKKTLTIFGKALADNMARWSRG